MPQYYAILDNGVSNSKGKAMPARKKYVRSYLKSKGVAPTRDASMRSKREKRLRGEARAAYAKSQSTRKPTARTSGISADRRPENKAKVDRAERARQERMRPRVDREAKRQLKGRSQNKNYVRGKNR